MYLGIWQLKELKDAMSNALFAGSKVEETQLLLTEEARTEASLSASAWEKADKYSPEAFVGDAKGLSGRLCSKLQLVTKMHIFDHSQTGDKTIKLIQMN